MTTCQGAWQQKEGKVMKRILMILLGVMVTLCMVMPVLAATKVPKQLCVTFDPGDGYGPRNLELGSKKDSSIRYGYGKETFYTVQGWQNYPIDDLGFGPETVWALVDGSANAYNTADGPIAYFSVTSDYFDFYTFELYWNMSTGYGNLYINLNAVPTESFYSNDPAASPDGPLTIIDCKSIN
jgi:hypothetical protein